MTWQLDSSHSQIQFTVRHLMISKVRGLFEDFTVVVDYDEETPANSTVEVTIDTGSASTNDDQRDGLRRAAVRLDADHRVDHHVSALGARVDLEAEERDRPAGDPGRAPGSQGQVSELAVDRNPQPPGLLVEEITKSLGDLSGKIIIDPTNPLKREMLTFKHAVDTSNSEIIQAAAPDAHVVKAFNTLNTRQMIDPDSSGGPVSIPLVGNDDSALKVTSALSSLPRSSFPARVSTPPGWHISGKTCPGCTKSSERASGATALRMVSARS